MSSADVAMYIMGYSASRGPQGKTCADCGLRSQGDHGLRCSKGSFYVRPYGGCRSFTPGPDLAAAFAVGAECVRAELPPRPLEQPATTAYDADPHLTCVACARERTLTGQQTFCEACQVGISQALAEGALLLAEHARTLQPKVQIGPTDI